MPKLYDIFPFIGGLDVNTPYIERTQGTLIRSLNYEPDPDGGYRLSEGYERFDGKQSPTDSRVTAIPVNQLIDPSPTLGDTIAGDTSAVTGNFISQESNFVLVTNASGVYQSGETLNSTTTTTTAMSGAAVSLLDNEDAVTAYRAAREYNRVQIGEVPGSGDIHAVIEHEGVVYAIRNSMDNTVANIYRASDSGWQLIDLSANRFLNFDNGAGGDSDPFAIGNDVTGETSGATGTVTAIGIQSANRQAGYIVIDSATGTFEDNENIQVGGVTVAVVNGSPQTPTLNPNGSYKFATNNFYAGTDTNSIYLTNGEQTAIQFDGESIAPIFTGFDEDRPIDVVVHQNHLFLVFPNARLVHSVIGEPLNFRGDLGAADFGLGSNITGVIASTRSLVITTEADIKALYGAGVEDWVLALITDKSIGSKNSGQFIQAPLIVDRSGLLSIDRIDNFGNYQDAIISDNIRPIFNRLFDTFTTSIVNKFRNHYMIFSESGENILAGFANNAFLGYFPFNLGRVVSFASANEQRIFFVSSGSGFVYHLGIGTSNDGQSREAYLQTSYAFQGEPQRKKRYRRATISLNAFLAFSLNVAFSFGKGNATIRNSSFSASALGGGGRWDIDNWDEIIWDGQDVPEVFSDIDGVGTDVSMVLYSDSAEIPTFTIEDMVIEYSPRSLKR